MRSSTETSWWDGILDPGEIGASEDRLAISDLSYRGSWPQLFTLLDGMDSYEPFANVNSTRLGRKSHFTPLHQAAWSGDEQRHSRTDRSRGVALGPRRRR